MQSLAGKPQDGGKAPPPAPAQAGRRPTGLANKRIKALFFNPAAEKSFCSGWFVWYNPAMSSGREEERIKKIKSIIKTACFLGAALCLIFLSGLLFVNHSLNKDPFGGKKKNETSNWNKKLNDFDALYDRYINGNARIKSGVLETMLDALEKNSVGAESRLSLLKRRRALAALSKNGFVKDAAEAREDFLTGYRDAAYRAAEDFPYSSAVCAIAAEAVFWNAARPSTFGSKNSRGLFLEKDEKEKIKSLCASLLDSGPLLQNVYLPLVFYFLSLNGSIGSLEDALQREKGLDVFSTTARNIKPETPEEERLRETLIVDSALISLLKEETRDEAGQFITMLNTEKESGKRTVNFLADYYYDFGGMTAASEFFLRLQNTYGIEMAACALYLAGKHESALNFWRILRSSKQAQPEERLRAIYNITSLQTSGGEESPAPSPSENSVKDFEAIFTAEEDAISGKEITTPAFVLYTRLLPGARGKALLEADENKRTNVLIDWEIVRRETVNNTIKKNIGETWLLLNRHPSNYTVYEWAAWYFERQKEYGEASLLKNAAVKNAVNVPAVFINEAINLIHAGELDKAEEILAKLKKENKSAFLTPGVRGENGLRYGAWAVSANLALIQEKQGSAKTALENYEDALRLLNAGTSSKTSEKKRAALIWLHMARCYNFLGQKDKVRTSLENALQMDADNVNVHLAISRIES
ncbi:MAG: hypothetical protein LBC53_02460 [Spirochaetaceae bacterium]|nr:hypothetical protein [Spirochaetaceae bacterium]